MLVCVRVCNATVFSAPVARRGPAVLMLYACVCACVCLRACVQVSACVRACVQVCVRVGVCLP